MTAKAKPAVPPRPEAFRLYPKAYWDGEFWRDGDYWYDERTADKAAAFFPDHLVFTEGEWAGRPFVLEPWEEHDIVRPLFGWKRADGTRRYRRAYVWIARKNGKAIALDTPIPTPDGWKALGDIEEGDTVFDDEGVPCRVTFCTPVQHDRRCFRVSFSDGTSIVADADHLWSAKPKYGSARIVSTAEIARRVTVGNRASHCERNWTLPLGSALNTPLADLPLDPYVLGAWLGDGNSGDARITLGCGKRGILDNISAAGCTANLVPSSEGDSAPSYWLRKNDGSPVVSVLRSLGVIGDKHIPDRYLRCSIEQRRKLLRGLLDTDGHVTKRGQVEIVSVYERLRDGIVDLVRGLGYKATCSVDRASIGAKDYGTRYRIQFWAYAGDEIATEERLLNRLKAAPAKPTRASNIKIVGVEPVPSVPVKCIQVDSPRHLYRAGLGMTVTHNTELAAGIALLILLGDAELGGQVFSIASEKEQASIVFTKASNMAARSATLSGRLDCLKTSIYCAQLNASFRPLSGKPKGKHGLNMSGLVGDEIHEWVNGDLYQFVHDSAAARRQPLEFMISTAGQKGTHGEEVYQECQAIAAGEIDDPETMVVIYAPDPDDDWTKESTWKKANPNFGKSVKIEPFLADFNRARQLPRLENNFKRYRLNIWTEQAVKWLPIDAVDDEGRRFGWDHCIGPLPWKDANEHPEASKFERRLWGKRCFVGIDLSSTNDLSAIVYFFPVQPGIEKPVLVARAFKPEDLIKSHSLRDRLPYDRWVKEEALFTTPGNVVDYAFIQKQLYSDAEKFKIAYLGDANIPDGLGGVAIDRWNATETAVKLRQEGLPVVLFGQGFASMSAPAKELERLVMANAIEHGGHPVFRKHAQAVAVEGDAADNIKPSKDKSSIRIDLIVAGVMAIGIAARATPEKKSFWEVQ